jgi:hypothetical protein
MGMTGLPPSEFSLILPGTKVPGQVSWLPKLSSLDEIVSSAFRWQKHVLSDKTLDAKGAEQEFAARSRAVR